MTERMTTAELQAWLEELQSRPTYHQSPRGLRWLDRVSEPESPWLARGLLAATLGLWVWSLFDIAMLGVAAGVWLMWTQASESLHKHRSKARLAAYRAGLENVERQVRHQIWLARIERAITPEWML